jgi:hypothetical protein
MSELANDGIAGLQRLSPGVREDLLRILEAPVEVRGDYISQSALRPEASSLVETLRELHYDDALRAEVVDVVRRLRTR